MDPRVKTLPLTVEPEAVQLLIECLDGKQLAFIRDRKKVAEMVFNFADEEIKRRLERDPDSVPGFALKPGNKLRKITDTQKALELLDDLLTARRFASCCTVSIVALEDAYREAHASSAAQSRRVIAERLGPVIEEHQNKPSVVRARGRS